jgi:hypothetical protein
VVPLTRGGTLAYGALLARGEHLAVLDPGDIPAPGLLESAGRALEAGGRRVAAAQAVLAPPSGRGLVSRWLAAESAAWHDLVAPGLARLGLPLPLASTGIVLRRQALEDIGGWDPDCTAAGIDLGLRLHKSGLRATTADSAVGVTGTTAGLRSHALAWQGALGAWLVQLRHPWRTMRRMGPAGTIATAVLGLGAVIAPLLWIPVVIVAVLGLLQGTGAVPGLLPDTMVEIAGAQVVVISVVLVLLGVAGARRRRSGGTARAALLAPLAYTAVSLAAWLGLGGLIAGLAGAGSDVKRPWSPQRGAP